MQATYDRETDTIVLKLNEAKIVESDEEKPGLIIDYDALGNVVRFEILEASTRVANPALMEFGVSA